VVADFPKEEKEMVGMGGMGGGGGMGVMDYWGCDLSLTNVGSGIACTKCISLEVKQQGTSWSLLCGIQKALRVDCGHF
jgi:hypothetical protein